jgi:CRISPR-associated protein Csm1
MTEEELKLREKYSIILGALLHDFWKFLWLSEKGKSYNDQENLTLEFFNKYIRINDVFNNENEFCDMLLKNIKIESVLPLIIDANEISEHERISEDIEQPRRPLVAISSKIDIGLGKEYSNKIWYFDPLHIENTLRMPKDIANNTSNSIWKFDEEKFISNQKENLKDFKEEIQNIKCKDIPSYVSIFYEFLKKYTTRVLSEGYKIFPDISLFDHSRTTAALALAKHQYDILNETDKDKERPFFIIHGDLSGIQKFIYKMASKDTGVEKKRAHRLKGRSFYLILLIDTITNYIVSELNIFKANILFSGGGSFIILGDNTDKTRNRINEIEKEINVFLFEKFKGDLGLVITTLKYGNNIFKEYTEVLKEIVKENIISKKRKNISILKEIFYHETNNENSEPMDVCPICQRDERKDIIGNNGQCSSCEEHTYIGRHLFNANYLIRIYLNKGEKIEVRKPKSIAFEKFDTVWVLCKNDKEIDKVLEEAKKIDVKEVTINKINDVDFYRIEEVDDYKFAINYGYQYIGKFAPIEENGEGLKDFKELAELNSKNYPLLGILRMDVDWLGTIFRDGFGENKKLSRVATLSRDIEQFFSFHINELAKEYDIYITYSGGDDLFVVGSWTNIIDFAIKLRNDFKKYTCENNNFSISGGIFFCKESFPIGKAAEIAGKRLDNAKNILEVQKFEIRYFKDDREKDAISIFNREIHWDSLKELLNYAKELEVLLNTTNSEEKISKGFIHSILGISLSMFNNNNFDIDKCHKYISKVHYAIARKKVTNKEINNEEDKLKNKKIQILQKLLLCDIQRYFSVVGSYILLKNRKK